METALRWASVDNRKLYNRYHHTKKKRIRKKYAKRILEWYRAEIVETPNNAPSGKEPAPCYDADFLGADDCTNTACPYFESGTKCKAAEGCPGREAPEEVAGNG